MGVGFRAQYHVQAQIGILRYVHDFMFRHYGSDCMAHHMQADRLGDGRMSIQLEKAAFTIATIDGIKTVSGYAFDSGFICDLPVMVGIHKEHIKGGIQWVLSDSNTGYRIKAGYRTRRDAVGDFENIAEKYYKAITESGTGGRNTRWYRQKTRELERMCKDER